MQVFETEEIVELVTSLARVYYADWGMIIRNYADQSNHC